LLIASKSRVPVGTFVYPGNTNDATTLPNAIEVINKVVPEVNKDANIELVMDRIYITAKNVQMMRANEEVNIKWLGPLKSGLSEAKFQKTVDEAYEKNLWEKISYRSPKEIARNDSPALEAFETTWVMSEEIKPELEPGQKRRPNGSIKKIEVDVRCVVYKDPKKAYNEKKSREEKRQKLEKKLVEFSNKLNKRNLKTVEGCKKALDKILKNYPGFGNFLKFTLNGKVDEEVIFTYDWKEDVYKKEENYDGVFALLTEYSKEEKNSNTLIGLYRARNEVEMNFRDLKGILDLERLFVREPERIDAYIFLKVLAYFVLAFLRWYLLEKCNVKTTESKVQEALGNINIVEGEFSSSNITFCGITGDNMLSKLIREKFGLTNPYKSINEINENNVKKVIDWLYKKAEDCSDIAENSG
jgi:transposase